jgi:hypothetical protein
VIDKQNPAGHVIQAEIASAASLDVADANRDLWLNREVIIGFTICVTDKDVVIPNTSHRELQTVMETTWLP